MEKAKALERMTAACSRREYCRKEIRAKLERLEADDIDGIIDILVKEKYIDETRYAAAFARDRSSLQGWGAAKIRMALRRKEIPEEAVASALEGIDSEAAGIRLESLLKAKLRSLRSEEDPRKLKIKILRWGLGRGYGYDEILSAYDNIRTI